MSELDRWVNGNDRKRKRARAFFFLPFSFSHSLEIPSTNMSVMKNLRSLLPNDIYAIELDLWLVIRIWTKIFEAKRIHFMHKTTKSTANKNCSINFVRNNPT